MATQEVNLAVVLTHQDMCDLFGLNDEDLPTSTGYGIGLLSNINSTNSTVSQRNQSIKRVEENWRDEVTQQTTSHTGVSFSEQTSSKTSNYVMALLESAAFAQDVIKFQALVRAMPWSFLTASDFLEAIRMSLALESPIIARQIAEQGTSHFPTHSEINKYARILATPTVKSLTPFARLDVKANKLWIMTNRENFKGKWVALHNGKLIAYSSTFPNLTAKVGDVKGKGILITQVT